MSLNMVQKKLTPLNSENLLYYYLTQHRFYNKYTIKVYDGKLT